MNGSRRRVFPLAEIQTTDVVTGSSSSWLLPPKSPLHGATRPTSRASSPPPASSFDRMLMLRNMNVTGGGTSLPPPRAMESNKPLGWSPPTSSVPEISAAQAHKERKQQEARRREEVRLMTLEDYTNTPEGEARRQRREEQMHMAEEELLTQQLMQLERQQRREERLRQQREEEARIRDAFLLKRKQEQEEQARIAKEKEAARKAALEAKMQALKEAADAQARAQYALKQQQLQEEARKEAELRQEAMENTWMQVEDVLGAALRQEWLVEEARRQQIEAEAREWQRFEEEEAARREEETRQRRAAQAEQYAQDRQRRMQLHQLQKERARMVNEKTQQHQQHEEETATAKETQPEAEPVVQKAEESNDAEQPPSEEPVLSPVEEVATLTEPSSLIATESEDSPSAESTVSSNAESEDTVPIEPIKPVVESEPEPTAPPPIVETVTLSTLATTPFSQVLSVHAGSPAAHAGLCADDLLLQFGGITSDSPKCLLAIAELVQSHVNQAIPIEVLRAVTSNPTDEYQRFELQLTPRKWKGKGLLGCQLSPFKWPPEAPESPPKPMDQPETTQEQHVELLVIHNVLNDSLAHRLGLQDGDMLSKCGDLSTPQELTDLPTVSAYIQTHWRAAKNALPLELHRWMPQEQSYTVVSVVIPSPEDSEASLGCSLTTYTQYYYGSSSSSACHECLYTSLASAMHAAAVGGHLECLSALWAWYNHETLEWKDEEGRSALFYACYAHQLDVVQFFLTQLGAEDATYDADTGADLYGDSPLHAAAASGATDVAVLLLESRFIRDVNLVNHAQLTPAHMAVDVNVLTALSDRFQADLVLIDNDGRMPLLYACLRQDVASVKFLCARQPELVDYADAHGDTALHLAAWHGFLDVVQALLPYLPSIALYTPNADGQTAYDLAQDDGVRQLLSESMALGRA
ncbi:hypothetical protein Poli38472_010936 [Pythium oligandrum]|uniref:PDZ domain-containing protein n=1 Tax=Pythium oligandrum TaxID=41045 RepID=A0A8K1FKM9_PYTOL|nr:hypothetical protein Poli38472_010936 [Pythium oligandrum]|eukprot:TMW61873.1 hypothetical protein Poli38472_010936 [Pythium oligandrum]